ncbi:MAG: SGNH/GDSL hydrolase family protein [Victivallaceae bacterium]|nr:SGNH/GDSL hydrolase family protein [Victivallaceae bacterium]
MHFTLADFKQYTRGVARVATDNDGKFYLKRMTADLETFYSYSEVALARAKSMAGVRICFNSDAEQLKLKIKYGTPVRNFFKLHCYIDDQLQTDGPDEFQAEAEICFTAPGNKTQRFELHLPHCCEVTIAELELVDATTISPAPEQSKTWLLIGDSITQGMTATGTIHTFSTLTARKLDLNQHNIAVGGAVLASELSQLGKEIDCDLITIAFGTNDFNSSRNLQEFQQSTVELLAELTKRDNCKIALITTIPWPERSTSNDLGLHIEAYRDALRQTTAKFPTVTLIEGSELIPEDATLFVDNIHPNNQGMQVYANNLSKELSKLL